MKYEITELRTSVVVRPQGCLGTMGWIDGKAWDARFFKSRAKAQTWISKQTKRVKQ